MDELEKIGEIISKLEQKAPGQLAERVVLAIEIHEKKSAKIRAWAYSGILAVTTGLLVIAGNYSLSQLKASGSWQTFSLLFSDFQVVMSNFNYFMLSLAESLPVIPIIGTLLAVMAFIVLAGLAVNNFQKISKSNILNIKYAKHI